MTLKRNSPCQQRMLALPHRGDMSSLLPPYLVINPSLCCQLPPLVKELHTLRIKTSSCSAPFLLVSNNAWKSGCRLSCRPPTDPKCTFKRNKRGYPLQKKCRRYFSERILQTCAIFTKNLLVTVADPNETKIVFLTSFFFLVRGVVHAQEKEKSRAHSFKNS
jgi:hypothetical protein